MAKSKGKGLFREVKGKVVKDVEIKPGENGYSIGIMFQDRTFLSFDVEVDNRMTISPELSDWKTKNYKPLKRWRTIHG
ncbi:MAG TPA: hypothetical protein VGK22_01700 [Candidatus Angelobacter sp.]|jgi:hypothetical protein